MIVGKRAKEWTRIVLGARGARSPLLPSARPPTRTAVAPKLPSRTGSLLRLPKR